MTIVEENLLPGESDAGQYTISGFGDPNNQGFARQTSINAGQTLQFAVDGDCEVITIYRIGHYGGDHWRDVDSDVEHLPHAGITIEQLQAGSQPAKYWK